MNPARMTRREALSRLGATSAPLVHAQESPARERSARLTPVGELVNLLEFEDMARLKLAGPIYSTIAGSDRQAFDRMTLRPRMMVSSSTLDLTAELFGQKLFAPILVGPMAQQQQFHAEGELATVRGASAAKTTVVISNRSSHPFAAIAAQANTTLWYQVYSDRDTTGVRTQILQAVKAGCKAVCITAGDPGSGHSPRATGPARRDWRLIDALRQGIDVPVLLKGVTTEEDARRAIDRGIQGLVVSNGGVAGARPAPIEVLSAIVDAAGENVPVLVDGSFRRGTDVIKALALGARGVLIGRPPMWGLAAYGANGVSAVLAMLQTELARTMINVGKPTVKMLDRSLVKIHSRTAT